MPGRFTLEEAQARIEGLEQQMQALLAGFCGLEARIVEYPQRLDAQSITPPIRPYFQVELTTRGD